MYIHIFLECVAFYNTCWRRESYSHIAERVYRNIHRC